MTDQTITAEALRLALETGASLAAATDRIVRVTVDDGDGGEFVVPVVIAPGMNGAMQAIPLLDVQQRAIAAAREERLRYASGPDRREGTATLLDVESFIAHALRFADKDSAIWADANARKVVSVLDYHPAGADAATRWGKHRGVYNCPLSDAWRAWGGGAPLELDQDALAALLDSRDRELTGGPLPTGKPAPDPAWLISMASTLETYSGSKTKRERDIGTGRMRLAFSSESGFLGDVAPPPSFLILIPVFEGRTPQPLEVRLRAAVEDGAATFTVQIHAAGDVLRDAFRDLVDEVGAATKFPVFIGTPE